jgi:hypothetical protein
MVADPRGFPDKFPLDGQHEIALFLMLSSALLIVIEARYDTDDLQIVEPN